MADAVAKAPESGGKNIDPRPFLMKMVHHGRFEVSVAVQLCEDYNTRLQQNPWSSIRQVAWRDTVDLRDLFESESLQTQYGQFFDQRFIDYLFRNFKDIDEIHWRKCEGLTAEFFTREGFDVELGPGRNIFGPSSRPRAWATGPASGSTSPSESRASMPITLPVR